jgi:excisionase family DNA binding protein
VTPLDVRRARVNINQAAKIAGVSRRTVYNWLDKGKVEFVRNAGGHVRIYVDSLLRPDDPPPPTNPGD